MDTQGSHQFSMVRILQPLFSVQHLDISVLFSPSFVFPQLSILLEAL